MGMRQGRNNQAYGQRQSMQQPMQPQRGGDDFMPRNMFGNGRDMDARRMQMQQARNAGRVAGPTPFIPASGMGQRVTTMQAGELGLPGQGPFVVRDMGDGQYSVGNDPNNLRMMQGNFGKYFT
jgi:hypothetical protein